MSNESRNDKKIKWECYGETYAAKIRLPHGFQISLQASPTNGGWLGQACFEAGYMQMMFVTLTSSSRKQCKKDLVDSVRRFAADITDRLPNPAPQLVRIPYTTEYVTVPYGKTLADVLAEREQ
jgi:hypothetical protein